MTGRVDVLAQIDAALRWVDYSVAFDRLTVDEKEAGETLAKELREARAAVAELIESAKVLAPRGLGHWERTPGGIPCGTFTVERTKWNRYAAALTRLGSV